MEAFWAMSTWRVPESSPARYRDKLEHIIVNNRYCINKRNSAPTSRGRSSGWSFCATPTLIHVHITRYTYYTIHTYILLSCVCFSIVHYKYMRQVGFGIGGSWQSIKSQTCVSSLEIIKSQNTRNTPAPRYRDKLEHIIVNNRYCINKRNSAPTSRGRSSV
jgi:hypothetical protein